MELVGRHEEFFDEDIKYASIKSRINSFKCIKMIEKMIKIEKGKMKRGVRGGLRLRRLLIPHTASRAGSMPPPRPAPPRLSNPTEISYEADWDAVAGAAGYVLLVKSVADMRAPRGRHAGGRGDDPRRGGVSVDQHALSGSLRSMPTAKNPR